MANEQEDSSDTYSVSLDIPDMCKIQIVFNEEEQQRNPQIEQIQVIFVEDNETLPDCDKESAVNENQDSPTTISKCLDVQTDGKIKEEELVKTEDTKLDRKRKDKIPGRKKEKACSDSAPISGKLQPGEKCGTSKTNTKKGKKDSGKSNYSQKNVKKSTATNTLFNDSECDYLPEKAILKQLSKIEKKEKRDLSRNQKNEHASSICRVVGL